MEANNIFDLRGRLLERLNKHLTECDDETFYELIEWAFGYDDSEVAVFRKEMRPECED